MHVETRNPQELRVVRDFRGRRSGPSERTLCSSKRTRQVATFPVLWRKGPCKRENMQWCLSPPSAHEKRNLRVEHLNGK